MNISNENRESIVRNHLWCHNESEYYVGLNVILVPLF